MRIKRVSSDKFRKMVDTIGKCQFVRLPSTNGTNIFTGLIMADSAWVMWPETDIEDPVNGLTPKQMELFKNTYGEPPDIFTPNYEEKVKIVNRVRLSDE